MFEFRQEVRVFQTVTVPAKKRRTTMVLARPDDKLRVLKKSTIGKGMWLCRNLNHEEHPPLVVLHESEIHVA